MAFYLNGSSIWDWTPKPPDSPLCKRMRAIKDKIIHILDSQDLVISKLTKWSDLKSLHTSCLYDLFHPKGTKQPRKTIIWKQYILPRNSFILWLCFKNRLRTKDHIAHVDIDPSCVLCSNELKTTEYLFFQCDFCHKIWKYIRVWLDISRFMSTIHSSLKWLKKEARGAQLQRHAKWIAFAFTVYCRVSLSFIV